MQGDSAMKYPRWRRATRTAVLAGLAFGLCGTLQESAAYSPPRTEHGQPDLQGIWSNASITSLERPARYKSLVLTPDEVAAETEAHPQVVRQRTDDNVSNSSFDGSDLQRGRGYNAFWIDPGMSFGLVKGEYRTSWIVDPADGRIPYSEQGRKFLAELAEKRKSFDGPEVRPLGERCLSIGTRVGPPMINGLYNNNYQIVQTADYVVIRVEMIAHARIIPLNGRRTPQQIPQLFGNSVGRWDGDTLVVETTNFHPLQAEAGTALSPNAKVTERFTRVSDRQILYEFTVEDPFFYSRPWRGEVSFNATNEQIYEYACHEGNYALEGVLRGARQEEKEAAQRGSR
jgi:hypothetical protein